VEYEFLALKPSAVIIAVGLAVVALTGASLALLAPRAQSASSAIAFATSRDGNFELYSTMPPTSKSGDSGSPTRLTKLSTPEQDPAFSADGSLIAFASKAKGDFNIHVALNAAGAKSFAITSSTANDVDPTWSPKGSQIALT
jgi:Tol biopolymer transport system component